MLLEGKDFNGRELSDGQKQELLELRLNTFFAAQATGATVEEARKTAAEAVSDELRLMTHGVQ